MSHITCTDSSALVLAALASAKNTALSSLGAAAAGFAKTYVPVDTGRLRDSLGFAVSDDAVSVGSDVGYAAHVEFGVLGQPGAHYLRDALAMHIEDYAAILTAVLGGGTEVNDTPNENAEGGEENGSDETKKNAENAE